MNSLRTSSQTSASVVIGRSAWYAGLAASLAESFLLSRGKRLWEENLKNLKLPLSKWDKLYAGLYIILHDVGQGFFPPVFNDQQQAYLNEINSSKALPGVSANEAMDYSMAKPFWFNSLLPGYLKSFQKLVSLLQTAQITPSSKLLELGGGCGWMAEFMAQLGFQVVSTTISPEDVQAAGKRTEALKIKGVPHELRFVATPMETVFDHVKGDCPFDAVFVFEALHHAFDWKEAIASAYKCLRPGGYLLICGEPNVMHTAVSYRVAKLSNTHEIGFSKRELVDQLKAVGFRNVVSAGEKLHFFCRPHWLVARK